jgi:hypothetical protein
MIEEWMPRIAIGGGFVLLFALVCIALWIGRRRRHREAPRRTSFHMAVIDPRVAEHRRAAWERPVRAVEAPAPIVAYSPALRPRESRDAMVRLERERPRRLARGSTPAIENAEILPARPTDWELGAPSVTARMRAAKRM